MPNLSLEHLNARPRIGKAAPVRAHPVSHIQYNQTPESLVGTQIQFRFGKA
jgi:hypothetical protein